MEDEKVIIHDIRNEEVEAYLYKSLRGTTANIISFSGWIIVPDIVFEFIRDRNMTVKSIHYLKTAGFQIIAESY